jgi:hypothetical protein
MVPISKSPEGPKSEQDRTNIRNPIEAKVTIDFIMTVKFLVHVENIRKTQFT